jgi:hypothetical protein
VATVVPLPRNPPSALFNTVGSRLDVSICYLLASPKLHRTMYPSRHEDYIPLDDESDSTSDSDTDSLFDSSDNKADTASDTDLDKPLEEVDSNTDDDDDLFDDEVRHLPEYYLAASANLDIGRLRQKRYSPKTQGRLD